MIMNKRPRRAALYSRVSTDRQTVDNQERELKAVAEGAGWEIVEVYRDVGISGAKGRDRRPAFDALCKDAARRKFDLIMAWSVDRLGRSLQDLVGFLSDIHASKVDLFLQQQGIDTTTPGGKALFQMMGVFAEFERAMIRERVNAGLARVKATGKTKTGRPLGRPRLDRTVEDAISRHLDSGKEGIRKTARRFGVGTGTVQRIQDELFRRPRQPTM
jgi:DNA invertase Pin-like site-specific DNA recombinase